MKRFSRTAFQSGWPFALVIFVPCVFGLGLPAALALGIAGGALFGLSMATFLAIQRRRFAANPPDFTGESLLFDGPANHFRRGESVGGWLYLTTRRLLFRSHGANFQDHELELPLTDVTGAEALRTAWIIPNGLLVTTAAGGKERFMVEQNKRWSELIASAGQEPDREPAGAVSS